MRVLFAVFIIWLSFKAAFKAIQKTNSQQGLDDHDTNLCHVRESYIQTILSLQEKYPNAFHKTFPSFDIQTANEQELSSIASYDEYALATLEKKHKQKQAEQDLIEDQYKH